MTADEPTGARRTWSARRAGVATAVVLAVVAGGVGLLWALQRSLVFFPDRTDPGLAAGHLDGADDVALTTSDGLTLTAWHLPPAGDCDVTVLVAPGNGGNRAGRADLATALADRGLGVLLVDYRGYGGNPGSPSEDGLARDVRAARDFLVHDAGVSPARIAYLGESLGGAVVTELATEHPPAAMVLRSPFTSLADAGRAAYGVPVGWLLRDRFAVVEHVTRTDWSTVPLAVVAGDADTIVPPGLSHEVAWTARDAGADVVEVVVPGANHNDGVLAAGTDVVDALLGALDRAGTAGCG